MCLSNLFFLIKLIIIYFDFDFKYYYNIQFFPFFGAPHFFSGRIAYSVLIAKFCAQFIEVRI